MSGKSRRRREVEGMESVSDTKSQESFQTIAAANSKLWETRVEIAEKSRNEFRDSAKRMAAENEDIRKLLVKNEKDTVDVITFLKEKLTEKQKYLETEQEKSRAFRKSSRIEKEALINDFTSKITRLEQELKSKNGEISAIKDEIKFAYDFRRKRSQMEQEIKELKNTITQTNKLHKEELSRVEQKFTMQKIRIEKESQCKIEELTEQIHREAISNLDETTKNVFKDNVRLKEALNLEVKHNEVVKKVNEDVLADNYQLREELKMHTLALKDKIKQDKQGKRELATYKNKVETLENSLTHVVREFETETEKYKMCSTSDVNREPSAINIELVKLQRMIEIKTREMAKIKRLAKNILDQRTELEFFFMNALDHVRSEIAKETLTLKKRQNTSFESRFERRLQEGGHVDIEDLTWTQKERVLRYLFAKMNGQVTSSPLHTRHKEEQ